MRKYKLDLKERLLKSGWEIKEIDDDTDWWLEEVWTIKSVRQCWGYELYLHFLVDLQYEGDNKSSAVWCVSALEFLADSYTNARSEIAVLELQSGKFSSNIRKFVDAINTRRDTIRL